MKGQLRTNLVSILSIFGGLYFIQAQQVDYDSLYLVRNCVILDAKESIQEEREDLIYNWSFGDGTEGHGEVVEHCYEELGEYEVMLSIVDPHVLAKFEEEWFFQVEISEDFMLTFGIREEKNQQVEVTSSLSFENLPLEANFFWDYGDGSFGVGENMKHRYDSVGEYTIRLLAQVNDGSEVISLAKTKTVQIN